MSLEMPVLCDEDPTESMFVERVGFIDEWHVDLRKPKGGSDMGKAGLSWDDGAWQPSHPRQGGPPCAMLTEVPFTIR